MNKHRTKVVVRVAMHYYWTSVLEIMDASTREAALKRLNELVFGEVGKVALEEFLKVEDVKADALREAGKIVEWRVAQWRRRGLCAWLALLLIKDRFVRSNEVGRGD